MKSLARLATVFLFCFLFVVSVPKAQAQHACSPPVSCCGNPIICDDAACTINCRANPTCTIGNVSGLTYSIATGGGYHVTLDWNAATNADNYIIRVIRVSDGVYIVQDVTVTDTTYTFDGTTGQTYSWTITPNYGCGTGTTANGPLITEYVCGASCCGTQRICTDAACTVGCYNYPACSIGNVSNLTYSGTPGVAYGVTLSWSAATSATSYIVRVTRVSDNVRIVNDVSTGSTTYNFTGESGESYNWSITPHYGCGDGTTANGSLIGIPDNDDGTSGADITFAYGQAQSCVDTSCNDEDIIVGLDADHNQIIPIRVVISDPNAATGSRLTDIQSLNIVFDNNSDTSEGLLRLLYEDNGSGTRTLTKDTTAAQSYGDEGLTIGSFTATADATRKILTINFNLNLNNQAANGAFLANVYLNATDFSGITTGRALKVGTSDFTASPPNVPSNPYGTNAIHALDIWNGRDVKITDPIFDSNPVLAEFCSQSDVSSSNINLAGSYLPSNPGSYLASLNSWWGPGTSYYQPYYYYNNGNYEVSYTSAEATRFLYAGSTAAYGGSCGSAVDGVATNNYKNGGWREEDSGVGNNSLEVAFGVLPLSNPWSKIIDGSFLTNSALDINIEPLTCTNCYFSGKTNSPNNGLIVADGDITINAGADTHYGLPNNWYAKVDAGTNPFTRFQLPTYTEVKNLYEGQTYTELSGNQLLSNLTITANTTYFIDGNLTIDNNSDLRAATDSYLLFIINGNLIVNSTVKDPVGQSAIEGIFIVLGNGTSTGNITVNDNAADIADALTFEGSLAAAGSISFARDLGLNNGTTPAVNVVYRPDMVAALVSEDAGIVSLQRMVVSQ